MAKTTGKTKTRQTIKVQTMRELMFASGGRCAMTDCGLPLTSPTGGWIGTVAHIVGAEKDAPRGAGSMSPEDRASFDNLILMCATHGREVDAPDTGEANFPIEKLRIMKETHEAKVADAVAAAIEQELSGAQTAIGAIDTGLRPAKAATSADGLLESLGLTGDPSATDFVAALDSARAELQKLSQLALDTLSELLALWMMDCHDAATGSYDFGDVNGLYPSLPVQNVENRVLRGGRGSVDRGMDELRSRDLIDIYVDEYDRTAEYTFRPVWELKGFLRYDFWRSVAWFLSEGYGVGIHDWIRGLDFSIFDRVAPAERPVPWR